MSHKLLFYLDWQQFDVYEGNSKQRYNDFFDILLQLLLSYRYLGCISASGQLPTYPSPNPTLTLTCYQLIVVGLGEG